jgi:hypothetical protein
MNRPDLDAAMEELLSLGTALIRNFHTGPFPSCTRLARNIRTVLTPRTGSLAFPDTVARADAMLCQVTALQADIAGLPGIGAWHEHRLAKAAGTLADYRAALEPTTAAAELLAA